MALGDATDRIVRYAEGIPGVDPQAVRDGLTIGRLHREIQMAVDKHYAKRPVSLRQLEILEALFLHPGTSVTPAELADEILLTRPAVTSNLDALERKGHLRRVPHPTDRRMLCIQLTTEGRSLLDRILPEYYRTMARIVSLLTPAQRRTMGELYAKVAQGFRELLKPPDRPV